VALMAKVRSHCSLLSSVMRPICSTPATQARRRTGPSLAWPSARARSTAWASLTSTVWQDRRSLRPASPRRARPSASRSRAITRAPRSSSSRVTAAPMPLAAPVTAMHSASNSSVDVLMSWRSPSGFQTVLDLGAGQPDAAALGDVAHGHLVLLQREVRHAVYGQEGLDVLHEGFQGRAHAAYVCVYAGDDELVAAQLGQLLAQVGALEG